MPNRLSFLGAALPQLDAEDKVRGRLAFSADLGFSDMLCAEVLRSPHPHARIRSIDTSAAHAVPGVLAVISGEDLPSIKYHQDRANCDRYPLARDSVRFFGEEVAAVAAETPCAAREAMRRIDVHYAPLPCAIDAKQALAKRAPEIHRQSGSQEGRNVAASLEQCFGDIDRGFEQAALILEGAYRHGSTAPALLEPDCTVALYDEDGQGMVLWTASETPALVRKEVASVLALDLEQVHIKPIAVAGGLASRAGVSGQEAIAAALAFRCRRPVRLVVTRDAQFTGSKIDCATVIYLKQAIDEEGGILARSSSLVVEKGAYTHEAPRVLEVASQQTASLYQVGAARCNARLVYTNRMPGGAGLGMGAAQMIWAIEDQIDQIAEKLAKDPLQYRVEQANRSGQVTPLGWRITSCELAQCLQIVGESIGWREKRAIKGGHRGVGVASMIQPCAAPSDGVPYAARIAVQLKSNGRLALSTQTVDSGAWQNTLLAQLCAHALGLDPALIDVVNLDAELSPTHIDCSATNVTFVVGRAVLAASEGFVEKLREQIAFVRGTTGQEVVLRKDRVHLLGETTRYMSLREVHEEFGSLRSEASYSPEVPRLDPNSAYGNAAEAYAFGAQAVELEVDPDTGRVEVLKVVVAQDVGRLINPHALKGQVCQGVMRGLALALSDELHFERGRPVSTAFKDFGSLRFADAPDVEVIAVESVQEGAPFGAKSGGEFAIAATVAAVGNAIADALGIRLNEAPFSSQKLRAALKRKSKVVEIDTQPWARPGNALQVGMRTLYPNFLLPVKEKFSRAHPDASPLAQPPEYLPANSVEDALKLLLKTEVPTKISAGGTDLQPGIRQGIYRPELVLDISRAPDMREVVLTNNRLRIGAAMSLNRIAQNPQVVALFPVLANGISRIATNQIRNMATIGGNLCQQKQCSYLRSAFPCHKREGAGRPCYAVAGDNRKHSIFVEQECAAPCPSDLAPILDVLEAELVVRSVVAERRCRVAQFYRWSGEPRLAPDEMLVAIEIPIASAERKNAFEKFSLLGSDFAEASVAASIRIREGRISYARLSLGSVSPFPERPYSAERALVTRRPSPEGVRGAALLSVRGALPTKHNRYKVDLVVTLVERVIARALNLTDA